MMVESTRFSPICIANWILQNVPPRKGDIADPSSKLLRSRSELSGGDISIIVPSMVERDVADEPIIWFIASEMAER